MYEQELDAQKTQPEETGDTEAFVDESKTPREGTHAEEAIIDEIAGEAVEQTLESEGVEDRNDTQELTEDGIAGVVDVDKAALLLDLKTRHEAQEELRDEDIDLIADIAVGHLRRILACFGEEKATIDEYEGEEGELILEIAGGDLAILIGRHGHTLSALQQIISTFVSKQIGFRYPLVVDVEGYKSRRKEIVADMAQRAAQRAQERNTSVSLKPMNAYERRLVHMALKDNEEVITISKGEDPYRFVVVKPSTTKIQEKLLDAEDDDFAAQEAEASSADVSLVTEDVTVEEEIPTKD